MNLHKLKIRSIFFLPLIVSLLAMVAVTGCSDEEDALQTGQYGYVQFKLYKAQEKVRLPAPPINWNCCRMQKDKRSDAARRCNTVANIGSQFI